MREYADFQAAKAITEEMFRKAVLVCLALGSTDPEKIATLTEELVSAYWLGVEHGSKVTLEAVQEMVYADSLPEETKH